MTSNLSIAALVLVVSGVPASADDADNQNGKDPPLRRPKNAEALKHLEEGRKLYNLRKWSEAAGEYTQAYMIEPAPIIEYGLGQCYRHLGKQEDAIWHYRQFVRTSPQTPEHVASATGFIKQLQAELDAAKANQAAATQPAVVTPEPGAVTATPVPSPSPQPPIVMSVVAAPRAEQWYQDAFGWGLAGAGVVAIAVGGGLYVNAGNLDDQANHTAGQMEANALHDRADTRRLLGEVVGAGGVALLVTGVIKLAIHDSDSAPARIGRRLVPTRNGLAVLGRF